METLVKQQEELIREQKNIILDQSLLLATIETRLCALENMPKIAWALQPSPVTAYMIEGIVNNTYEINGKYRIKIQGGSKMRIAANNRWKNKSLTPHENKWIQAWGDSSLLFDQPKVIWQKIEETEDEKPIEKICNPRITLEWGWTSTINDPHPVVPTAEVANLGMGEDWVRIAIPKNNTYKGADEMIKKESTPPARACWKILHYLPGRAGDKSNKLPRVLAYAPTECGKYPHEVWNWYTQAHLSGNWIKSPKIKIHPIGQVSKIMGKEIHSSTAKRLSEMMRDQQEMIDDQNEQLSNIRMIARYEYAHKSARKAAATEITELHQNHQEELDETRQQLKEALEEIDRRNKEIHRKKDKEIRGPGRRVKQEKKAPKPSPPKPPSPKAIPKIVRNNPKPTNNFRDELLKKQKSKPKPKLAAPRGPWNRLRQKQDQLTGERIKKDPNSRKDLPPPAYYRQGREQQQERPVKKKNKEEIDLWNTVVAHGETLSEKHMENRLENRIIEQQSQNTHRKTDISKFSVTTATPVKRGITIIISGAQGCNANLINGKYTRVSGKNYMYSRGKVENYEVCLYFGYDRKWWIGTLNNGLKRVGSGWAHTITAAPGNAKNRLLPQPQAIKPGDWEALVSQGEWKRQPKMVISETSIINTKK
jgi:hypothetical protein